MYPSLCRLQSSEHVLGLPVGQHIMLSFGTGSQMVSRAYTPVSSDDDIGYVDFVIKVYFANVHPRFPEGGKLTQHMEAMVVGDTLKFRGPKGHITYGGQVQ